MTTHLEQFLTLRQAADRLQVAEFGDLLLRGICQPRPAIGRRGDDGLIEAVS